MACIIVAMPKAEDAKKLANLIKNYGFLPDVCVTKGSEVLQEMQARDYGIAIIPDRLSDMGYLEILEMIPDFFELILLSKDNSDYYISGPITKLRMPVRGVEIARCIDTIENRLSKEVNRYKNKPVTRSAKETEILNKAKQIIMEKNMFSEPEAYRYIRKMSMDKGLKITDLALQIVRAECDN